MAVWGSWHTSPDLRGSWPTCPRRRRGIPARMGAALGPVWLGRLGWLLGADCEGLGAAERDVGVEGERLGGGQAQAGVAAGQLGDGDLRFQAAKVSTGTKGQALAESQGKFGG